MAARFPDRVAIDVAGENAMTFAAWRERSDALARTFVDDGVRPDDRVVLLLPAAMATRFSVAYTATHQAGALVVPVNPRYAARELEHVVANCEPSLIVTGGDQETRARVLGVDRVLGDENWPEAIGGDASPCQVPRSPSDLAEILYTSGTTGLPKGVTSTHESVLANDAAPLDRPLTLLHSAPLPTTFGSLGALIMPLRLAMTSLALPNFDTERFGVLIEERRPAWLLMVPAQILLLLESGALDGRDTSSVRMVMFGSAPTPPHVLHTLADAFPRAALDAEGGQWSLPPSKRATVPIPPRPPGSAHQGAALGRRHGGDRERLARLQGRRASRQGGRCRRRRRHARRRGACSPARGAL